MAATNLLPLGLLALLGLAAFGGKGSSSPPPPSPRPTPFPSANPFPSSPLPRIETDPFWASNLPPPQDSTLLPSFGSWDKEHFVSLAPSPSASPSLAEVIHWTDPAYERQFGYPRNVRSSALMRMFLAKSTPILEAGLLVPFGQIDVLRSMAEQGQRNPSSAIYLDTEESVDFFANLLLGAMLLYQTPQGRQSPLYHRLSIFFRLHRFRMDKGGQVWKDTLFLVNRMACGGAYAYLTAPEDEKNYTEVLLRPVMRPWKEWTGLNALDEEGFASGFEPSETKACSLFAIQKADGRWVDQGWQQRALVSARIQAVLEDGLLCLLEHAIPRYTNSVFLAAIDPKIAGQIASTLATGGTKSLASFVTGDIIGGAVNLVLSGITAAIQVAGQFDKDKELRLKANTSIEAFMQQFLGRLPRPDRIPSVVTTAENGTEVEYRWPLSSVVTWLSGFQLPLLLSPMPPFDAANHWDVVTPVFFHYGAIKGFTATNPFLSPEQQIPGFPMLLAQPPFLYRKIPYAMIFGTGGIGDKWLLQPSSFVDASAHLVQGYTVAIVGDSDLLRQPLGSFLG